MRLLSLSLNGRYKGLQEQNFDFSESSGQVIALIGLNGSGKSQLLELIAECFAFLERVQRSDFKVKTSLGFGFTLEYQIHERSNHSAGSAGMVCGGPLAQFGGIVNPSYRVELAASSKTPQAFVNQADSWQLIPFEAIQLPRIVGYSSGLNENLQRSFLKNANQLYEGLNTRARRRRRLRRLADEYRHRRDEQSQLRYPQLIEELNEHFLTRYPHIFQQDIAEYGVGADRIQHAGPIIEVPLRSSTHVYLDYDSAQLAIASLAILDNQMLASALKGTTYHKPVLMQLEYDLENWVIEEDLTKDIKKFIGDAFPHNVAGIGKESSHEEYEEYELEYLRGIIDLDFTDLNVRNFLAQSNLDSGLRMFERLYRIQQLGLKKLNITSRRELKNDHFMGAIKKPLKAKLPLSVKTLLLADAENQVVSYDDLSDGEAQLLQILSIITLYKDEQTLFLFDEPETHLNPAWRTHFQGFLQQALLSGIGEAQVFLATHSPFMISSLYKENVFMFQRDEDGTIDYRKPSEQTYGASFDVLIKMFFGLHSLISQSVIEEIREQLKQGDSHARQWIEQNLGMSPEKAYLMKRLEV